MDFVTLVISIFCIVISVWILRRYFKKQIGITDSLIYATVFRYYSLQFLGPTVDVLFIVSYVISLSLILRTKFIHKKLFTFLLLFFVSFCLFVFINIFFETNLGGIKIKEVILNNLYFIIKYLFPLLAITNFVLLNGEDTDRIFSTFKKAALFSCGVSILQILLFITVKNNSFREIAGLTGGEKYMYEIGSLNLVRVQAFCYEPKGLAVIMALALPLFLEEKSRTKALFCFVVGVLTVSQTFFLVLLAYVFIRIFLFLTKRVSLIALFSIFSFFLLFNAINLFFDKIILANTDSAVAKVVLNRALERFDLALAEENNDLFGFPLQRDIELPAVNYFKENKIMLLSGFGPGNYKQIPIDYFVVDWNIDLLENNQFKGHFDMGWVFFTAELGIIFTIALYILFSGKFIVRNKFDCYYAFLLVVFFFHRIDFLLFCFFAIMYHRYREQQPLQETIYNQH